MDSMGGILTKGLGASACGHLIFGPFRLHVGDTPHQQPVSNGGGSSIRENSRAAHIIQQRIDQSKNKQPVKRKKQITITYTFNNKMYDKTFIVDVDNAEKVVKVVNWVNKTRQNISILINNMVNINK